MSFFTVHHRSRKSKARIGSIATSHGVVQTPSFVPVATKGTLKSLSPEEIKEIGVQIQFVNTYHLVTHPGADIIEQMGGIHTYSHLPTPLLSDSAGFQVFSLAKNSRKAKVRGEEEPLVVKIHNDGVVFRSVHDGSIFEFTPEKSMEYQVKIGADMLMAFDECTYYPAGEEYARHAMERSHQWLTKCIQYLQAHEPTFTYPRYLYGIIQGGTYEALRKESAEFVALQQTPGVAIGGVAVGESKKEMREVVSWVAPYLPHDRPVHLLGVGGFDDIYDLVQVGIDTFDCVEPTRMARMGVIYDIEDTSFSGERMYDQIREVDITKNSYRSNGEKVSVSCSCYTCTHFTKSYLHHLFKQKELFGYRLATIHNLTVMEKYMHEIRRRVEEDRL